MGSNRLDIKSINILLKGILHRGQITVIFKDKIVTEYLRNIEQDLVVLYFAWKEVMYVI